MDVLSLPLSRVLNPAECSHCVRETLLALLFLRSQTPTPFADLTAALQASAPPREGAPSRRSSTQRAALKLVDAVAAAMVPADAFASGATVSLALVEPSVFVTARSLSSSSLSHTPPQAVLFALGGSATRPREVYELRFGVPRAAEPPTPTAPPPPPPPLQHDAQSLAGAPLAPLILDRPPPSAAFVPPRPAARTAGADAARRVIRALVQSLAGTPDSPCPQKVFLLLRMPPGAMPPPSFLPKQSLSATFHHRARLRRLVLLGEADAGAPGDGLWCAVLSQLPPLR